MTMLRRFLSGVLAALIVASQVLPASAMLQNNNLIGFGVGATDAVVQPATVTFVGCTENEGNNTTYSFAGHATGDADAARTTVVGVLAEDDATNFTINSGTIGGVAATLMGSGGSDTGALVNARFMGLANPAGTTATIAFTLSEAGTAGAICVWSVLDLTSLTPTAENQDFETSSASMTLGVNTTADGVVLGISTSAVAGATTTWTGLSERADGSLAEFSFSAADFDEDGTPSTPLAITSDHTGTADAVGKVIVLR